MTRTGTTTFATDFPAVVSTCCGGDSDTRDIWFRFKATCTNGIPLVADISTCHAATSFDTVLTVFSGTCENLTEVACNDDATAPGCQNELGLNRKSKIIFVPSQGQTYYVRLAGFGGAQGSYQISFSTVCQAGPLPR